MDFLFTEEQHAFRREARAWILDNLPSAWRGGRHQSALDEDADARFQREWERSLYQAGYAGLHWPADVGGRGLSLWEHFVFQEELGRAAAPEGINSVGRELVGPILLSIGSQAQKQRFLPRILDASEIWCQGFSEPNAGSDLNALGTRADPVDAGWRVKGQKVWTSYARYADFCILLARTESKVAGRGGLTLFIVPMKSPGITVRPLRQLTGRAEFNEVFFDDVVLPEDSVIGKVNEGWSAARRVLNVERGINRLYRQGRYTNELAELRRLCSRMKSAAQPAYRAVLGRLAAELRCFRLRNYQLVDQLARGMDVGAETSIHKLYWSELHQRLTACGSRLAATAALECDEERGVAERFFDLYTYARAETILAGTSQIQHNIIADRVLQLPRGS